MNKHDGTLELTWTDKNKALLSTGDGKYDYTFVDPTDYRVSEVRLLHEVDRVEGEVEAAEARPPGLPAPTADNLLITGDAMHVLDALNKIPVYADQYVGRVKLVYIDPPFNTGQAFTTYEDNIEHSIWLTMLRDRVRQIKSLLSEDGSIWVHLDDAEVHRCRSVLDEELGAQNFVGTVIWGKSDTSRNDAKQFSTDQDYLLVYSKAARWRPNRLPRRASHDAIYGSPDGDPHAWLAKPGHAPGAKTHPGMVYAVQSPFTGELLYPPIGGCWRLGESRMFAALNEWAPYKRTLLDDVDVRAAICDTPPKDMRAVEAMVLDVDLDVAQKLAESKQSGVLPEVYFINNGTLMQVKGYKPEGLVPRTFWPFAAVGSNRNSKAETKRLFPGVTPFDTPKPEGLLQRVITLGTEPGDIVLDCFAGSGTTAAVAHKLGRRWVTSELLSSTVDVYTKKRLRDVVNGRDAGSASFAEERVASDDVLLPAGVTPEAAQQFQRIFRKVVSATDDDRQPADDNSDDDLASDDDEELLSSEIDKEPRSITVDLDAEIRAVLRAAKKDGRSPLDNDEVKVLQGLLRKMTEGGLSTLDVTQTVRSTVLKRTNTKLSRTTLWHGGGSFVHLVVGPSMFTEVGGMVLLADWAANSELAKAMCAQISVHYRPDGIFAATHERTRYVVLDGMVGSSTVSAIVDRLADDEIVEVWATQVEPGAIDDLRQARPGSTLNLIPAGVLNRYRRKSSKRSPFALKGGKDDANGGTPI